MDTNAAAEPSLFSSGGFEPGSCLDKAGLALSDRGSFLCSVPGLRGHTERLADMVVSRVPFCLSQELQDMRMAMSAMPLEESIQMSAWALKSAGTDAGKQALLRWAPA